MDRSRGARGRVLSLHHAPPTPRGCSSASTLSIPPPLKASPGQAGTESESDAVLQASGSPWRHLLGIVVTAGSWGRGGGLPGRRAGEAGESTEGPRSPSATVFPEWDNGRVKENRAQGPHSPSQSVQRPLPRSRSSPVPPSPAHGPPPTAWLGTGSQRLPLCGLS